MKLVSVGTVAFDAIETPFGKTDKIVGGACTYISLSASYFNDNPKLISVVGDDFPEETIDLFHSKNIDTENGDDKFLKIVKNITSKGFIRSNYEEKLVDLSDVRINLKTKN